MILAIIAVITVPIILNIIENSKTSAITNSAYGYRDAVNKYYVLELEKDGNFKFDGEYSIIENGNLEKDNRIFEIQTSGKKPSGGTLTYRNNVIIEGWMTIENYKVEIQKGKAQKAVEREC